MRPLQPLLAAVVLTLTTTAAGALAAGSGGGATGPREIMFVGVDRVSGRDQGVLALGAAGTGERTIAPAPAFDPAWSPDGTRVVYQTYPPTGLLIVPAEGGQARAVTVGDDQVPNWSPNGRWIAFVRGDGSASSAYLVRPDGTGLRKLSDSRVLGWAPGSQHLLASSGRALVTLDLDGGEHPLAHARCAYDAAWSPDGRWIAFAKCLRNSSGIAIEHPNGTHFLWLTRPRTGGDDTPAWAPDSKRLAYVADRAKGDLDHTQIRIVTIGGANITAVRTSPQDHDVNPRWSPDGRQIVFDREDAFDSTEGVGTLYLGDAKNGGVRQLYREAHAGSASWRPH